MSPRPSRFGQLLVGVSVERTRRAVILAGVFVILGAVVTYLNVTTQFENEALRGAHRITVFNERVRTGGVLIVGLAAIHAYLNEGYLPSVTQGVAPYFGANLWSRTLAETMYLDPVWAVRRTAPEVLLLATVGFVLGVALRGIGSRRQNRQQSTSHEYGCGR